MPVTAAILALVPACGRLRFSSDASSGDGPVDTPGSPGDGAVDAPGDGRLTYRDAVLADGPIGYWRMGDAGNVVRDETGHHDGAATGTCLAGAPGALAGDPDPAIEFDGASCTVTLGNFFAFPANAPYTVEASGGTIPAILIDPHVGASTRTAAARAASLCGVAATIT